MSLDKSNNSYRQINHLFHIITELEKCETPASARKYISTIIHLKDDIKNFFELAYGDKDRFKYLTDDWDITYRELNCHEDRALFYFNDFLKEFQYYNKDSHMKLNIQKIKITTGLESLCKQDAKIFFDVLKGKYKNKILTPRFIKDIFLDINI